MSDLQQAFIRFSLNLPYTSQGAAEYLFRAVAGYRSPLILAFEVASSAWRASGAEEVALNHGAVDLPSRR
jgi:hypothetical protein